MSTGADIIERTLGNRFEVAAHLRLVIFVSLRTAASAMAPWSPMLLFQRLQGMGEVREQECQRALTRKRTLWAAAHSRLVIIVSLRTAASAEAPSTWIVLTARLQGMGGGSERVGARVNGR